MIVASEKGETYLWTHCRFHARLELSVSLNQSHLVWPTPAAGRSAGEKHPQTCCCRFSFASRRTISVRGMTRCFLQQQRSPLHRLLLFLHFLCSSLTPSSVFTPTWWPLHPQSSFHFNCFYQHSLSNPVWECLVSLCLEETATLFAKKKGQKCNMAASHPINCLWRSQLRVWKQWTLKLFTPKTSPECLQPPAWNGFTSSFAEKSGFLSCCSKFGWNWT